MAGSAKRGHVTPTSDTKKVKEKQVGNVLSRVSATAVKKKIHIVIYGVYDNYLGVYGAILETFDRVLRAWFARFHHHRNCLLHIPTGALVGLWCVLVHGHTAHRRIWRLRPYY